MKFVSARAFKAAIRRDRKAASDLFVRKLLVAQPEPVPVSSQGDDLIRFTVTTGSVDRDLDRVSLDGWELDNYLRNPVVLWAHEAWEPPIGRAMNLLRDAEALKSDVRFVPESVPLFGPRAEGIKQLCRAGFLFATSVGFRPLEWDFTDDEARGADDWFPGIDFLRQELMELSIVSIPANPEALIEPEGGVIARPQAAQPIPEPAPESSQGASAAIDAAKLAAAARLAAVARAKQQRRLRARLLELT